MKRDREALAWAAGLFEGEGWLSLSGGVRKNGTKVSGLMVGIAMTDFDRIAAFHTVVGFGTLSPKRKPGCRDQLMWRVTDFEHVQAFVAMLWPWLGPRRRARAVEILAIPRGLANANKQMCPQGHPYSGLNLVSNGRPNTRKCRECRNAASRKYHASRRGMA